MLAPGGKEGIKESDIESIQTSAVSILFYVTCVAGPVCTDV